MYRFGLQKPGGEPEGDFGLNSLISRPITPVFRNGGTEVEWTKGSRTVGRSSLNSGLRTFFFILELGVPVGMGPWDPEERREEVSQSRVHVDLVLLFDYKISLGVTINGEPSRRPTIHIPVCSV